MRAHQHRFRVLYGDTDMMGVVYYANYLRFFEAGRNELLRAAGLDYRRFEAMGFLLPVTEAKTRYHAPARYDDELELTTTIEQVRFGSLRLSYLLERGSELLATGETTHACVDRAGRVVRIPAELRAVLTGGER